VAQVWEEFISLSQAEQDRLLESVDYDELSDGSYSSSDEPNGYRNRKDRHRKRQSNHTNLIKSHQNLSGKQCFERIEPSLRTIIRRNSIALSLLEQIEADLIQVFQDDPSSIYQCCLDSGYDRFLLRACAQYHNLNCHSKFIITFRV
jgi:hypothetical protein